MTKTDTSCSSQRGFTLITMAAIVTILGLMFSTAAAAYKVYLKADYNEKVEQRQSEIQNALTRYFRQTGRLPCPAEPGLAPTSPNYGVELPAGAGAGRCGYTVIPAATGSYATPGGAVLTRARSVRGNLQYPSGAGAQGFHNNADYPDCSNKARMRVSSIPECGFAGNPLRQTLPAQCTGSACLCAGQALSNFATADGPGQNCVIGLMTNVQACKNKFMDPNYVNPGATAVEVQDFLGRCVIQSMTPCTSTADNPACVNWLTAAESKVWVGAVPVRTLGIPDENMTEPGGNLMIYTVTQSAASAATFSAAKGAVEVRPPISTGVNDPQDTSGSLTMTAPNGPGSALYAVISPGKTGRGAYNNNGRLVRACPAGFYEGGNCDNDAIFYGGTGTYSNN
jgi:type II secretory pathway pseudopilin PulG